MTWNKPRHPADPQRTTDARDPRRKFASEDLSIFPVEWPDLTEPWAGELRHPVGVHLQSLVTRPLTLHIALATLRIQTVYHGDAVLRLAVEPVVPGVHVAVLRSFPVEDSRNSTDTALAIPLPACGSCTVKVELRIDGEQVGRVTPALNVWASVRASLRDNIDEAIAVRRVVPMLGLGDDMSFGE